MVPTPIRDYPEWHLGRQNYALWYLEINDQKLVHYLDQLRAHFSEFLVESNHRQYHVTLFICGFLTHENKVHDDDFCFSGFVQQREILRKEDIAPFQLKIGSVDSFSSALFVEVQDQSQQLARIRQALSVGGAEIAALQYHPHITLGLYQTACSTNLILQRIQNLPVHYFDLDIQHLNFGYYQAHTLQGQLFSTHQFPLEHM